jgi:hypothetical protein
MKIKNPYSEGTPEYEVFVEGVAAERERLRSILAKYHENFGTGPIEQSDATMKIVHMYNFVVEKRAP